MSGFNLTIHYNGPNLNPCTTTVRDPPAEESPSVKRPKLQVVRSVPYPVINVHQENIDEIAHASNLSSEFFVEKSSKKFYMKQMKKDDEVYRITHKTKGRVLIIENNFETVSDKGLHLLGYKEGAKRLKYLWEKMGCEVELKPNLSRLAMLDAVKKFSTDTQHASSDYCVLIILSHGTTAENEHELVLGVPPREGILLKDIIKEFDGDKNSKLVGKPKLIIFQCCRGNQPNPPVPIQVESSADFTVAATLQFLPPGSHDPRFLPTKCDTMIVYATHKDNLAFVNESGSWLVNALVEVFKDNAHDTHVGDMMIEVKSKLKHLIVDNRQKYYHRSMQMPYVEDSCTKKLFLFPGIQPGSP